MKFFIFCLVLLPCIAVSQVSFNMTLLSNIDSTNLPTQYGCQYSDCWGYTAPNGTEVAIIALIEKIWFVDVTNPANPVIIYAHTVQNAGTSNTSSSLWRDFDTYQHYIYAVSDLQTAGLLIFDMSNVPATVSLVYQSNAFFDRSHTLFIDQLNAKLYAAGSNTQSNGLKVLDLTNPVNPTLFASVPLNGVGGGYVHDVYVRDNIAYCSHGSLSKIQIYDFSNLPGSFEVLGTIENYPEPGYNHSSWLNSAGNFLVMCDETFGSDVKIVNVADPDNISSDDIHTFYSELLGAGVPGSSVAHNPYIVGTLAYVSYYEDGVQVFDISNPFNVTSYAYYDTKPDNTQYNGYIGCWGVYPFFSSGTIIASDMNNGLFVMEIENGALGIEFLSFDASRQKENVKMAWTVTDAAGGNDFEVMRSSDGGLTFNTVGNVTLAQDQFQYTYTDKNVPDVANLTYRIDFVQSDGKRIHSPVRSVSSHFFEKNIQVVNPMSSTLTLDVLNPVESLDIKIYAMDGRLVWNQSATSPRARMEWPIYELIPGEYLLTLHWPGGDENLLIQVVD